MLGCLRRYMAFQLLKVTTQTARDRVPRHLQENIAARLSELRADVTDAAAGLTPSSFEAFLVDRLVEAYGERRRVMSQTPNYKVHADWNAAHMQETWIGARLAFAKGDGPREAFERIDALLDAFIRDHAVVAQPRG